MKPRLFWTMLLAFALVILLGVCGMLGFFWLAFSGIWQPQEVRTSVQRLQASQAATLSDYYTANGNSWAGVDQRLEVPPFAGPGTFFNYTLADSSGRIIASTERGQVVGRTIDPKTQARGVPIEAHGQRVGTLVVRVGPHMAPAPQAPNAPAISSNAPSQPAPQAPATPAAQPADFVWPIVRGFLIAGLVLALGLLLLAAVFAQRVSRPLRDITRAAQQMATGRLDVQVRRAPIREVDELTQAFNAMARSLADADRQRKQMTADIAHELRTPLTIIKGRLEGLQDGVYDATPEELDRLLHETALLERLIEDLRLLALAEAGQLPLYREPLDPRALLENARAAFAGQAAAQGVALAVEAPEALPPVDADPQRMAQVLANLVSNALRYTPAGGAITLRARLEARDLRLAQPAPSPKPGRPLGPSSLILEVCDTGAGIATEDLPHIFDRFYRADRARGRGSGGAGLGLAIAKQIVATHGGAIEAASEPGHGTTIQIALPAADGVAETLA